MSSGCVSIPSQLMNEEAKPGIEETVFQESVCNEIPPYSEPDEKEQQKAMLDSNGFKLLNWNIYKGKKDGWQKDLQQFVDGSDILTLQESYLAKDLRKLFEKNQLHWVGAAAYEYRDINAGVLTASLVEPSFSCSLRKPEPLIRVPKTAMITLYPVEDRNENLLVGNIHMINFTMGSDAFRSQLESLEKVLNQHQGPIIIAGDFNSWNDKRCAIVDEVFSRLNLKEVTFLKDNRSFLFGETVDRVFYRGLEVIDSKSLQVKSSDHNPVLVTFKLQES